MITVRPFALDTPADHAISTDLDRGCNVLYLACNVEAVFTRVASVLNANPRLTGSPRHHLVRDPNTNATARFHARTWPLLGLRAPDVLYVEPTVGAPTHVRSDTRLPAEWRNLSVVYLREGNL